MIPFMRYRLVYYFISGITILVGMFYLIRFGLSPAIDFSGGTLIEMRFEKETTSEEIKKIISEQQIEINSVQTSGENTYLLKLKPLYSSQSASIAALLSQKIATAAVLRSETVGPVLGQELLQKTFVAALIAVGIILSYVAWAFKNIRFGVCAILALAHDLLVVIGAFAILGNFFNTEVDSLFVTALLTTMSFSVHDTIVVFDRIREIIKKNPSISFENQINQAITETMGRSLNNSLTIVFMLFSLFLLGGETIRWFVLALLIGTISGTYSSPFVATPLLYQWHLWSKRKK